jgi:hypothetical protein
LEAIEMSTQLDFEKRKKRTDNSDINTENLQALLPPSMDKKQGTELDAEVFCTLCEFYHKPSAKLRCALNRAMRKLDANRLQSAQIDDCGVR